MIHIPIDGTRSQYVNDYDVDLIISEYSDFSTKKFHILSHTAFFTWNSGIITIWLQVCCSPLWWRDLAAMLLAFISHPELLTGCSFRTPFTYIYKLRGFYAS